MSYDEKKQMQESKLNRAETLRKIKSIASHVGLLVTLMIYTLIGGLIFRKLERPAEFNRLNSLKTNLLNSRQNLIWSVNGTNGINLTNNLEAWEHAMLRPFELAVQEAAKSGLSVELLRPSDANSNGNSNMERWSVLQAVFFASTILTTIGYGNVFPSTTSGRVFCIVFALIGIPLTLTVIADYGKLFASGVSSVAPKIRSRLPGWLYSCVPSNHTCRKSLGALMAVALLFLYLGCGAGLFMLWETHWSFFEGFYFCFVTMTTIGFGDVVPTNPKYMLFCTGYILFGLALTSTIIELVRRQYAQSWKKLQALRGPLGDTLRRLGEHAGGDMSALQTDLKRVLKVISMPQLRRKSAVDKLGSRGDDEDKEWEDAVEAILRDIASAAGTKSANGNKSSSAAGDNNDDNKPDSNPRKSIVQIIIYETSV